MSNNSDAKIPKSKLEKLLSESLRHAPESIRQDINHRVYSAMIVFSFMATMIMIGLKPIIGSSSSGGIITSFIAGMFGYATLDFLRRRYLE